MITFSYTVKASNGIHARPAGMLVQKAKESNSNIKVECRGKQADLKKLMALMLLNIKKGDSIKVMVSGNNEKYDAKTLEEYIKSNF